MARKGGGGQAATVIVPSPTRTGHPHSPNVGSTTSCELTPAIFLLWGKITRAMILPRPLRGGRALSPRALPVVGGGASVGWQRPIAV
ncbi:UNVERIFIED_CONTAM: hypothetical protein Sradi_6889700 [Sesamum radiatum]|uniref:Uncharacterized protein n=1 Tax=Sesamum radiatum TaxID=300843 RepID=A0AAW2JL53_SESRA